MNRGEGGGNSAGRGQDSAEKPRLAKTGWCSVPEEKSPLSWEIILRLCLIEATVSVRVEGMDRRGQGVTLNC